MKSGVLRFARAGRSTRLEGEAARSHSKPLEGEAERAGSDPNEHSRLTESIELASIL